MEFPEFRLEVATGSLMAHCHIQNSVVHGYHVGVHPPPGGRTKFTRFLYQNICCGSSVSFPKRMLRLRCPVEECLGGASNRANPWVHFVHRRMWDTIVILEEENQPYPRCTQCDMFVSHKSLNVRHLTTAF